MSHTCFLSGIEIPKGKYSKEHYVPKSRAPFIAQHPYNIFPAIKIINHIKGNLMPCEWEDRKYELVHDAYMHWNIKRDDKRILRQALNGMPKINPCKFCVCSYYRDVCVNIDRLEKSR